MKKLLALALLVACSNKVPEPIARDAAPVATPHKLGAGLDAGVYVPVTFALVTPQAAPFNDPPITAIELRGMYLDLTSYNAANGQAVATFASIGGDPSKTKQVVINLTPTQQTNFTNALKTAAASQFGMTFQ